MTQRRHGAGGPPGNQASGPGRTTRDTRSVIASPEKTRRETSGSCSNQTHLFFLLPSQYGGEQGRRDVITDHLGTGDMLHVVVVV